MRYLLAFALLILLNACKDKDGTPPTLVIETPYENSTFAIPCFVQVSGIARDESNLEYVSLVILDPQNRQITQPEVIYPTGLEHMFDVVFEITDPRLESGSYKVKIEVSDGENTISRYRLINLNSPPRLAEHLVYSKFNGSGYELRKLDLNTGVDEHVLDVGTESSNIHFNPYDQVVYNSAKEGVEPSKAYEWETEQLEWTINGGQSSPFNFFIASNYSFENKLIYQSLSTGKKYLKRSNGGTAMIAESHGTNYIPEEVIFGENVLYVDEHLWAVGTHEIIAYNRTSGVEEGQLIVSGDVRGGLEFSDNNIAFVTSEDSTFAIFHYSFNTSSLVQKASGTGYIKSVDSDDSNGQLWIATDQGLYRYDSQLQGMSQLTQDNTQGVTVDYAGSGAFVLSQGQIFRLDGTGITQNSWTAPGVASFDIRYNK